MAHKRAASCWPLDSIPARENCPGSLHRGAFLCRRVYLCADGACADGAQAPQQLRLHLVYLFTHPCKVHSSKAFCSRYTDICVYMHKCVLMFMHPSVCAHTVIWFHPVANLTNATTVHRPALAGPLDPGSVLRCTWPVKPACRWRWWVSPAAGSAEEPRAVLQAFSVAVAVVIVDVCTDTEVPCGGAARPYRDPSQTHTHGGLDWSKQCTCVKPLRFYYDINPYTQGQGCKAKGRQ